jgi:hypothetical protein
MTGMDDFPEDEAVGTRASDPGEMDVDGKPNEKLRQRPVRLEIEAAPGQADKAIAQAMLRPSTKAALTILQWSAREAFEDVSFMELIRELQRQSVAASRNDLTHPEAMLVNQANTLDTLFHELVYQARLNLGRHPSAVDRYMRLALRAQSQSRAAIEALAEIKNPKPVFVGQNNIAANQQVNNGLRAREEITKPASEVLEVLHESRLDAEAAGHASRTDSDMAAVVPIHRAANASREASSESEFVQARSAQS